MGKSADYLVSELISERCCCAGRGYEGGVTTGAPPSTQQGSTIRLSPGGGMLRGRINLEKKINQSNNRNKKKYIQKKQISCVGLEAVRLGTHAAECGGSGGGGQQECTQSAED